jgi:hemolysin activation/secretion protein
MKLICMSALLALGLAGQALVARAAEPAREEPEPQRGIQTAPSSEAERDAAEPAARPLDRTPVLPPPSFPDNDSRLMGIDTIFVRELRIEDVKLISQDDLAAVSTSYQGRNVTMEELAELSQKLSLLYFDRGYVNSGVVLPDQKVSDGIISFREVRGRLTDIQLDGNQALRDRYWTDRLGEIQNKTLQINELQSALQVIEQHPLVQRIQAQLLPGARLGESSLLLEVAETRPWLINIGIDNYRSPSLGGEQATLYAAHRSLTGRGDLAEIHANIADGLGDGGLAYTLPIGWLDSKLRAYVSAGDAEIVEAPFDRIDINTEVLTWGLELSHPFYRTPARSLTLFVGLESQHSESTLLDIPFSFSLGEVDGEATAVASIFGAEWIQRGRNRLFAARLSVRQGLDGFGAKSLPYSPPGLNGPANDFLAFRGQLQFVQQFEWRDSELHLRSSFQIAHDPLLPVEKMPVGGVHSVRGYRENLLVRDNGVTASLEWRLPLFPGSGGKAGFDARALTVAAFADFGQSWDQNTGLPSDRKEHIYSVGAGALWQPLPAVGAQLYYGEGLKDLASSGDDLQDRGWHFRVNYHF